ncbi:MAG: hypothetical protein CL678_02150 [Bdellovibrionaceae bacterium]|mgnify:CR=1 FL=1|nr:hypothetical protein [Pseudobdellovibrionaceae bacterium]|tara:strand:+ start:5959 stop:6204 length:246 start_codon:yes stop_codon:yes gene_type:complete
MPERYELADKYEWVKCKPDGSHERIEIFPTLGIWRVWKKGRVGPERLVIERTGLEEDFLTLAGEYIAAAMTGGRYFGSTIH